MNLSTLPTTRAHKPQPPRRVDPRLMPLVREIEMMTINLLKQNPHHLVNELDRAALLGVRKCVSIYKEGVVNG